MDPENRSSGLFVTAECPKCKRKYQVKKSDTLKIYRCKACGHAVPVFPNLQKPRESIHGLPLAFCLFLAILVPVKSIFEIIQINQKLKYVGITATQLYDYSLIDIILNLIILMWSLLPAFLLWKQRMGAIFISKSFLIFAFFYTLFKLFYLLTHPDILFFLSSIHIMNLILFLLTYGFWYIYLERSELIRHIYG